MIKKIRSALLIAGGIMLLATPSLAMAQDQIQSQICTGVNSAGGTPGGTCDSSTANQSFNSLISTIINIFSIVVGAVSVIMIIFGGFRYITSGGNDSNIAGAKNTIIYALIGLVIVALAQLIVHFVLSKAIQAGSTSGILFLP